MQNYLLVLLISISNVKNSKGLMGGSTGGAKGNNICNAIIKLLFSANSMQNIYAKTRAKIYMQQLDHHQDSENMQNVSKTDGK